MRDPLAIFNRPAKHPVSRLGRFILYLTAFYSVSFELQNVDAILYRIVIMFSWAFLMILPILYRKGVLSSISTWIFLLHIVSTYAHGDSVVMTYIFLVLYFALMIRRVGYSKLFIAILVRFAALLHLSYLNFGNFYHISEVATFLSVISVSLIITPFVIGQLIAIYHMQGDMHLNFGKFQHAIVSYEIASRCSNFITKNNIFYFRNLFSILHVYSISERMEDAREYLEIIKKKVKDVKDIRREHSDEISGAILYYEAFLDFRDKNHKDAICKSQIAFDIQLDSQKEDNVESIVSIFMLHSTLLQIDNRSKEVIEISLDIENKMRAVAPSYQEEYVQILNSRALSFDFLNNPSQAVQHYAQMLHFINGIRNSSLSSYKWVAEFGLFAIYVKTERFEPALKAFKRLNQLTNDMELKIASSGATYQIRYSANSEIRWVLYSNLSFLRLYHRDSETLAIEVYNTIIRHKHINEELNKIFLTFIHTPFIFSFSKRGYLGAKNELRKLEIRKNFRFPTPPVNLRRLRDKLYFEEEKLFQLYQAYLAMSNIMIGGGSYFHELMTKASFHSVKNNLQPNEIFVEYVFYPERNFSASVIGKEKRFKPPRYMAFLIEPSLSNPVILDLGEANKINRSIISYRQAIISDPSARSLDFSVSDESTEQALGRDLYRVLIEPILPYINGKERIIIAPDGVLSLLPFEVLPTDEEEKRVIDKFLVSYLSSGRELLDVQQEVPFPFRSSKVSRPIVVGNPDYNIKHSPSKGSDIQLEGDRPKSLPSLSSLPGTEFEAQEIASIFGVKPLTGHKAKKSTLLKNSSPRVLHIATHGYFQDNPSQYELDDLLDHFPMNNRYRHSKNVMLDSWLAFAGANESIQGKDDSFRGILTSDEIMFWDLSGTELVVLSACDSGLGEVRYGDGVFGFRRSFFTSGADTLVFSCWKVPDQQTAELMTHFYERLKEGAEKHVALRDAQLRIRANYPHPYFWGAFICQGKTKPLTWSW